MPVLAQGLRGSGLTSLKEDTKCQAVALLVVFPRGSSMAKPFSTKLAHIPRQPSQLTRGLDQKTLKPAAQERRTRKCCHVRQQAKGWLCQSLPLRDSRWSCQQLSSQSLSKKSSESQRQAKDHYSSFWGRSLPSLCQRQRPQEWKHPAEEPSNPWYWLLGLLAGGATWLEGFAFALAAASLLKAMALALAGLHQV